ncbi:ATP-binding protein [Phyllobacterium sp. YR531]|uniref:ATP-binding protein n=1 Tax=Phyllobacterium sp. YR531 TaxID=1144343 RepID=UPI00026F875C|nr:ATP-binding protein [Phyllobacterium sp. YR531]EJN01716.1 histidine kinase [Phyllobacterium sp. YR531]
MIKAALATADELITISNGLLRNGTFDNGARRSLEKVIESSIAFYPEKVRLVLEPQAGQALVPSSQFHLIIEELLRNAIKAEAPDRKIEISIHGRLRRRWLFRRSLVIDIADNGVGMTREVQSKAVKLFFSTRAGTHLGLGLTNIADSLAAGMGQLRIRSIAGEGTTIRIIYPL